MAQRPKLLPDATPPPVGLLAASLRVHLQSMAPRVATRQGDGSDFGALPMVALSSAVLAPDGAVSAPDGAVLALARKEDKNPSMKTNQRSADVSTAVPTIRTPCAL